MITNLIAENIKAAVYIFSILLCLHCLSRICSYYMNNLLTSLSETVSRCPVGTFARRMQNYCEL